MFIKPFKVKSNIQLKSSDRKKLKNMVASKFAALTDVELELIFPSKATICVMKVMTHSETQLNVYTVDKRPMFYEMANEQFYPTLYTLWLLPEMLPCFTTHPNVLPRMANGADLMLPGVVRQTTGTGPSSWGRFQKNDIVAVNLTSNKAPVAMGVLARSSDDMYMSGGVGPCVKVMHVFGDKLWGLEPTVCKQVPLLEPAFNVPKDDEFPELGSEKLDVAVEKLPSEVHDLVIDDSQPAEEVGDKSPADIMSDHDVVLKNAFLAALKMNGRKIPVPIIVSTFYPVHVQPFLAEPIEIKHTSYKKLQNFIKQMTDEGFLVVKEETKGVPKIMSINLEHREVITFNPVRVKKPEPAQPTESGGGGPQLLLTKMTELYAVNDDTQRLFSNFNLSVGATLDQTQIKNHLKDYVGRSKLTDPATKQIIIDETLRELCETDDVTIKLDQLVYDVTEKMTSTFEMRSHMQTMKAGKKQIIQLSTAKRSGNKIVTLISNLEHYNVNIAEFSKALKLGVAASATMVQTPGQKTQQLLVQGNQVRYVYDLLTQTYKIPRDCIAGLELARKEKKTKK
jgi:translation initiation factor 2D